jgi:sucrose-phosphate synthase
MLSVHGLVRGKDLELGRDADTGGQVKYVIELARALARHPKVEKVDLLTRLIDDPKVGADYAVPREELAENVHIVRISCGPSRYFRKEVLWPYLESFVDNTIKHLRAHGQVPDVIHGHYADAGYIGCQLASLLGIPFAFTGHSLGKQKRRRLLLQGLKSETVEARYNLSRRIEAEETALEHASFVVASTAQEVEDQYQPYDHYEPKRMIIIPPGVDTTIFKPASVTSKSVTPIGKELSRFLRDKKKPMILALARPDEKKNLGCLIRAYAKSPSLRELANLVLLLGSRDDLRRMDAGPRTVLNEVLYLVDLYDLYGQVAYPKSHTTEDVPDLYRMAVKTKGVFVNPAFTEPFGLTLIEAAACGLPVVATNDGGPREIISKCKNGVLIDPLNEAALGETLESMLKEKVRWGRYSRNGLQAVKKQYSWESHASKYVKIVQKLTPQYQTDHNISLFTRNKLITVDRMLVTDVDDTLIGDRQSIRILLKKLHDHVDRIGFGIATGRSYKLTREVLEEWDIPTPNLLITSVGTDIFYGPHLIEDLGWKRHISYHWRPDRIREVLVGLPGVKMQPRQGQTSHKVSYFYDPDNAPSRRIIVSLLRSQGIYARAILSHDAYLDFIPIRASKGDALRYFAIKWGMPIENFLIAGDSGNDEEMLKGNTLGCVVGNHHPELNKLRKHPNIYFADGHYAAGILEAIDYYNFLGDIRNPSPEQTSEGEDQYA